MTVPIRVVVVEEREISRRGLVTLLGSDASACRAQALGLLGRDPRLRLVGCSADRRR